MICWLAASTVNCGDHMFAKVLGNCMYVQRLSDGENAGNQCYNLNSDGQSAEAIAERSPNYPYLADFQSITFYGVGITDNGSYLAMSNLPHEYDQPYDCAKPAGSVYNCQQFGSTPNMTVGPIQNDPGDVPYDEYTVYWQHYGIPWTTPCC